MKKKTGKAKQTITMDAGTLYDVNKQLVKKTCTPLNEEQITEAKEKIAQWFKDNVIRYAMLLCNDIKYYTVFHIVGRTAHPHSFAATECIGCLTDQNVPILSIEFLKDNNVWEFWLDFADEPKVFYLFNYEQGVIEC